MAQVQFRRIRGRLVPIRAKAAIGAVRTGVGAYKAARLTKAVASGAALGALKKSSIEPKRGLQALSFTAAIADGVLSGATFFGPGAKAFLTGQGASIGLSAVSSAANVASFTGRGHAKARIKGAVRQEAINTITGNAAFGASLLAFPQSRKRILEYGARAIKFVAKKVVR